jgi:hypothetical protein
MSRDVTFGTSEQKVMKLITKCYIQIISYVHENVLLHISLGDILTYYKICLTVSLYIFMIFDELQNGIFVSFFITCCGRGGALHHGSRSSIKGYSNMHLIGTQM